MKKKVMEDENTFIIDMFIYIKKNQAEKKK